VTNMISRDKVKILGPLFQLKYKTAFECESSCKWVGSVLAVSFRSANILPASSF